MILVVEGEHVTYARLAERLGERELSLATTVTEARDRLETTTPTALVVGRPFDDSTAALVADVRDGRFGPPWLPVLAVTAGDRDRNRAESLGVDETVDRLVDEPALETAIERVVLLGGYKHAVQGFFDACHDRNRGPALRDARREADAYLEAIQASEECFPIDRLIDGD